MRILDTPVAVHGLELANRLVMPPMATAKADEAGQVTDALCDYYGLRTKGAYLGLVITEHSFLSPEGRASKGQLSIARDEDIPGLQRLTRVFHENDTKVFAQMNHAGGAAPSEITGHKALGPSAVSSPRFKTVPEEMSQADIQKVVRDFAAAAVRAKEAGYDGAEIHSAHGYLLDQFYSPLTNHRTDGYGPQSVDSRIRLHLEVIQAVRDAVGPDYPIALRLGASDYMEGGATLEDSVKAAPQFQEAGVDLLDISGGMCGFILPDKTGPGYFQELTGAIKKVVTIPVVLTGGITDLTAAEQLLEAGKADLIGVGRAILQDPLWAQKAFAGA